MASKQQKRSKKYKTEIRKDLRRYTKYLRGHHLRFWEARVSK
jgi:hypothetical protein